MSDFGPEMRGFVSIYNILQEKTKREIAHSISFPALKLSGVHSFLAPKCKFHREIAETMHHALFR